jgi:hypothetical protein
MIRIELTQDFPVSPETAFAYITEMAHWQHFFPGFVRITNPAEARWGKPGDRVTVLAQLFGRKSELHMELQDFRPAESVRFVLRQRGLPDMQHERLFDATSAGCACRFVAAFEPRPGLAGLFDRFLVKRAVVRSFNSALSRLTGLLRDQSSR